MRMRLARDENDVRPVRLIGVRHVAEVALALTGAVEALRSTLTALQFRDPGCVLLAGDEVEVVSRALTTSH